MDVNRKLSLGCMWRIIKDKTTAVQCIRLRYRTVSPPCFPQGAPMDWSYIKQGWSLTKVGEMNEVKYSQ